jgi:Fur family ferric uptake transcriptional regulator
MKRNTKQRQLILELVCSNHSHPTADEVYEDARKWNAHISKGTVYRNLRLLVEEGLLRRYGLSKDPDRYDFILEEHSHFVCRPCRKLSNLPSGTLATLDSPLPTLPGFKVEGRTFLLSGICPNCLEDGNE